MVSEVRMDERGGITIPREVREKLGLRSGDRLLIKVKKNALIIAKAEDPFKVIADIPGDLTFDRSLRSEAEGQALKELEKSRE